MKRPPSILDDNLRRLLRRAHRPVQPSSAFREALFERWITLVGSRFPRRSRLPALRRGLALAAVLLLLLSAGWAFFALFRVDPPPGVEDGANLTEIDEPESAPRVRERSPEALDRREPFETEAETDPTDRTLRGWVVDAATQTPLRSFEVRALAEAEPYSSGGSQLIDSEDGSFDLAGLDRPSLVFVRAAGYAPARLEWRGGEARFELERGVTLQGRVVDGQGNPVAGARVVNERDAGLRLLALRGGEEAWAETRTDERGRFVLSHASTGRTFLRASHEEYAASWSALFESGVVQTPLEIEIPLSAGGGLRGRVERANGTPWAGATLLLVHLDHQPAFGCQSYLEIVCDEEGTFAAENLPKGSYNLLVMGDEWGGRIHGMRLISIREGAHTIVDFDAGRGLARLAGKARDEEGRVLPHLFLTLEPERAEGRQGWKVAVTDEAGDFSFEALEPGPYQLYFTRDQGRTVILQGRHELRADETRRIDFRIEATAVTGRLSTRHTEEPVENALVVLLRGRLDESLSFVARTSSGPGGVYRFEGMAPGRYRVYALPADRNLARALGEEVEVELRGEASTSLVLEPGGGFELLVRDPKGEPVPDARIAYVRATTGLEAHDDEVMRTDREGRFAIGSLPPGVWTVGLEKEGYLPRAIGDLVVRPLEFETREVTLSSQ